MAVFESRQGAWVTSEEFGKTVAVRIAKATFRALAAVLIHHGVKLPEAEKLFRMIFVREAAKSSDSTGKPVTDSRLAVITGLNRHMVAALLKAPSDASAGVSARRSSVSRVIAGWLSDPAYTHNGDPQDLIVGDEKTPGPTAWALVRKYAPGVWPSLVVDEFIRTNQVEVVEGGRLRLTARASASTPTPPEIAGSAEEGRDALEERLRDVLRSIDRDLGEPHRPSLWRKTDEISVNVDDLPLIHKMLRDRLDTMFGWLNEELSSERWVSTSATKRARIGVSSFTFEEAIVEVGEDEARKAGIEVAIQGRQDQSPKKAKRDRG